MDVDQLLQYLIPIIFLIVWVIGRIFSPKRSEMADEVPEEAFDSFDLPEAVFEENAQEQEVMTEVVQKAVVGQGQKVLFSPVSSPLVSNALMSNEVIDRDRIRKTKHRVEILSLLKRPHAMRKVILASEILGPPLCLRKNGKVGRSWQR